MSPPSGVHADPVATPGMLVRMAIIPSDGEIFPQRFPGITGAIAPAPLKLWHQIVNHIEEVARCSHGVFDHKPATAPGYLKFLLKMAGNLPSSSCLHLVLA